MNQAEEPIFTVASSVYDEIQDLDNGQYLHPVASPGTTETSENTVEPAIPDSARYEKIGLPDLDNGTYIHPGALPDTPDTTVKEVHTRPVMFESARYETIQNLDNAMPDTSETAVKEVYSKPAIFDNE